MILIITLLKTMAQPLKIDHAKQETSITTIHLQVRTVSFREGIPSQAVNYRLDVVKRSTSFYTAGLANISVKTRCIQTWNILWGSVFGKILFHYPRCSMDGVFTCIYLLNYPNSNVGKPYIECLGTRKKTTSKVVIIAKQRCVIFH